MTHEFVTQPRRYAVMTARFLVAEEPGPHGSVFDTQEVRHFVGPTCSRRGRAGLASLTQASFGRERQTARVVPGRLAFEMSHRPLRLETLRQPDTV